MVQAWFHATLRSGRYTCGRTYLVGSDGLLTPQPDAGSADEQRLHQNPNTLLQDAPVPAAPPPPQSPLAVAAAPALVGGAPVLDVGQAWFHKTLRSGRYNVGGFSFWITPRGRLIPPPGADLQDRMTRTASLVFRALTAEDLGDDKTIDQTVRQAVKAPPAANTSVEGTLDADVGDLAEMRVANEAARLKSAAFLEQLDAPAAPAAVVAEPAPVPARGLAAAFVPPVAAAPVVKAEEPAPAAAEPAEKPKRGGNLAELNAARAAEKAKAKAEKDAAAAGAKAEKDAAKAAEKATKASEHADKDEKGAEG